MSEATTMRQGKNQSDKNDYKPVENSNENSDEDYDKEIVNDFPTMLKEFFSNIPWKLSLVMFVLLLVLFSKQFIEGILDPLGKGSFVDADSPTNMGTIVLSIFAVIGLIITDLLIKAKVF